MILKAVYTSSSGCFSGPDVLVFQRFQKYSSSTNKLDYQTGWDNSELQPLLEERRDNLLEFAEAKLKKKNPVVMTTKSSCNWQ